MIEEEQKRGNMIKVNQTVERKEVSEEWVIAISAFSPSVFQNWMFWLEYRMYEITHASSSIICVSDLTQIWNLWKGNRLHFQLINEFNTRNIFKKFCPSLQSSWEGCNSPFSWSLCQVRHWCNILQKPVCRSHDTVYSISLFLLKSRILYGMKWC